MESKRRILGSLNTIIERADTHVSSLIVSNENTLTSSFHRWCHLSAMLPNLYPNYVSFQASSIPLKLKLYRDVCW
jgi:hypothetical protein